ncbi:MAG: phosphate signaling complex protein PhoU [Bacteroidetes bacterium]|nr:phosphate signaling complex protein PhoU [Bacteroidota bacterium]MBS1933102.1 phosphate signaling complex protein PhoU [Bacteroidota bacterium]
MTQLETELHLLKNEVINMWNLVRSQLEKAKSAMLNFDKDLAREVVLKERRVNGAELKIDRDCENIFALLTPVAVDLRFVLAVLKINSNLERIGDIAEGIAKYVLSIEEPFNKELLESTYVTKMYDEAINILEDTLSAFENEDTILARSVFKKDEFLDDINLRANELVEDYLKANPKEINQALYILSVIRKLERVGDQSKNISEEIIFYLEAKVLKHKHSH